MSVRVGGWRGLGIFWAVVLVVVGGTAAVLQVLGPPRPVSSPSAQAGSPTTAPLPTAHGAETPRAEPAQAPPAASANAPPPQPRDPDEIVPPQPALLEPSKLFPPAMLPRIAANGQVPRIVYARPARPDDRPKVAVVVTGLGMSASESRAAIQALPGPISLAFAPYAANPDPVLEAARKAGHEFLLSLPFEPAGYPLNDAGSRSLLSGATLQQNMVNLEWNLSRIQGYVGAIGALDAMRGERFSEIQSNLRTVLDELSHRGLLYVDPRPGRGGDKLADVPGRAIDIVLDDPQARAEIEGKLAALERLARDKGSAIGFAGPLRPVTVDRIAAWANGLADRGIALVPVSALINPLVKP